MQPRYYDLIFTLVDQPNPDRDEQMAEHVLQSRQISGMIARDEIDANNVTANTDMANVDPNDFGLDSIIV